MHSKTKVKVNQWKLQRKLKNFNDNKDYESMKAYLDELHENITYMLDNKLYDESSLKRDMKLLTQNNNIILDVSEMYNSLLTHLTNYHTLILKDEDFLLTVKEYVTMFDVFFTFNENSERVLLDSKLRQRISDTYLVLLNNVIIIGKYSSADQAECFKSFLNVLKRSEILAEVILKNVANDFVLTVVQNLSKNKCSETRKLYITILKDLLEKESKFLQLYFRMFIISNIVNHLYDESTSEEIHKLIIAATLAKNSLTLDESCMEEQQRLRVVQITKSRDKTLSELLEQLTC